MRRKEGWRMYFEIQTLKEAGLTISQIARRLDITRNTVYKYLPMTPDEFGGYMDSLANRKKKLDRYHDVILSWLKKYPELSSAQVYDWLKEKCNLSDVCEGSVRNYVQNLRSEHSIPKSVHKRQYEAVADPPMGHQMQVDFGEMFVPMPNQKNIKLFFIVFVLSNSRYKYVEWLSRPFTTADVINAHESAFGFFGGMPQEAVYDQDHLILVSENHGDLIYTQEFASYVKNRKLKIYMCRKSDPESKGRVENAVGFVKKNFGRCRMYHDIDTWNEACAAWLERTGNGKVHGTTNKIPAEVFQEEKKHLKPIQQKILKTVNTSITALVRKDNTIHYKSNRYTLPLGTYDGTEQYVALDVTDEAVLVIKNIENGEEIAKHPLCMERGKLIQNKNHKRNRAKGISEYMEHVQSLLPQTLQSKVFLDKIHELKPRYIRDQLQYIEESIQDADACTVGLAVEYCIKQKLYSASDFKDALNHFKSKNTEKDNAQSEKNIEPLRQSEAAVKIKPQIRDIRIYQELMKGGS